MSNISDNKMETPMNEQIGIVGAGLIGSAWTIVFARAGCRVRIYDALPEALNACLSLISKNLDDLREHGLIEEDTGTIMRRIETVSSLAEAVEGAALVQENVRETLEAKREVFAAMDKLAAPDTVLASSTSWLPASEFSEGLPGRGRMMVAHPVNPPYLVPLVELAPAPWTTPETIERARDLFTRAGQTPVLLKKEITGFLLNRIQGAVLNEVLNLYAGGYASVEDLDKVMKDGLGMRWSFMGPMETIDLNAPGGIVDYAARYGPTYREVSEQHSPNSWDAQLLTRIEAERRNSLPAQQLGERSRWRDNQLMALVAHRRRQRLADET
jgi:3-hydroxyacyl-CoA dehydrogenase